MHNDADYNPVDLFSAGTTETLAFGPGRKGRSKPPFPGPPPQDPPRLRLQALVDMLVDQLGLANWRVRGEFTPANDQFRAQLKLNRYFSQATVFVGDDEPEEVWDLLVAHELLHLVHDSWSIFFHELLGRLDSERERDLFRARIEAIEEPLMNALAEAVTGNQWPTTPDQEVLND